MAYVCARAGVGEAPGGSVDPPDEELGGDSSSSAENLADDTGKTATDPKGEVQESEDFARMIDESKVEDHSRDIKVGDKVSGVLIKIGTDSSFVDFGGRSEGVIKTSELRDEGQGGKGEIRFSEGRTSGVSESISRGCEPSVQFPRSKQPL